MDELDLRTIRAFVAVVDAGDFTAAARLLRVTPSAVGKALARLEKRLGVRLLHRTTRSAATTADGAVFYEHCVRLLRNLADAESSVRHHQEDPGGVLKLSLPDAYGRWRILPILQDYMRRWPKVGVEVRFSDRFDDVVEEKLDVAIRTGHLEGGAGLSTRVIDRIEGILCASPQYLAGHGMPDQHGTFDGHDLLLFGERDRIRPWPSALPPEGSRPLRVLDSAEALRMAALAGLGIAHLPNFLVASDLESGRLVALPGQVPDPIVVSALFSDRHLLPARVRLFIDMLVEQLR